MVDPANGLSEDGRNVEDFELGSKLCLVFLLWHRVGDNHLVDSRGIDAVDGVAAEDAMREESIDLGRALLLEELCGARNGIAGVGKIVDQDADTPFDVADEHHAGILAIRNFGRTTLLYRWLSAD